MIAYWHIGRNSSQHNNMPIPEPEQRSLSVSAGFRYLLSRPEQTKTNPIVIVAMHGYGSNPHTMLRLTRSAVGPDHAIASIEAPNQFYLRDPGGDVGYNWGVSDHAGANIALHQRIVLSTMEDLGVEAARCVLLGFSQPCGLNYRFIATHAGPAAGVIALCGGVPHDWETGPFLDRITCPVLHISRNADEFYPLEKVLAFPERLRHRIQDVEFHVLPGAHRFPSQGGQIIRDWLSRHFGV
jgi:predicted esterase